MLFSRLLLFVMMLFLLSCGGNSSLDVASIEKEIIDIDSEDNLNGVAIISDAKGEEILTIASGIKNSYDAQISPDSQFMIGDLANQFTAAALLKLLHEKISPLYKDEEYVLTEIKRVLHEPISVNLIAGKKIWEHLPKWASSVSIHNLLTNTSGIPDYTDMKFFNDLREEKNVSIDDRNAYILDKIFEQNLEFVPGSTFKYSRSNYFILSMIIEEISNMEFSDYVNNEVILRAKLDNTRSVSHGTLPQIKNQSDLRGLVDQFHYNPFVKNSIYESDKDYTNLNLVQGFGTIISTARDLHKWNLALFSNQVLFPQYIVNLMIKDYVDSAFNYGYGVIPAERSGIKMITSTGKIDCFNSFVRYFPDQKVSVVILTNVEYDKSQVEKKKNEIERNFSAFAVDNNFAQNEAMKLMYRDYFDNRDFYRIISRVDAAVK